MDCGLSPAVHPAMSGVPVTFEPIGLGGATGRGAEPRGVAQRSAPLRSNCNQLGRPTAFTDRRADRAGADYAAASEYHQDLRK